MKLTLLSLELALWVQSLHFWTSCIEVWASI